MSIFKVSQSLWLFAQLVLNELGLINANGRFSKTSKHRLAYFLLFRAVI